MENHDISPDGAVRYKELAAVMLSREYIEYKLSTELGEGFFTPYRTKPPHNQKSICVRAMPLGTLLHITAGNIDGLPAFSLAEGLLTGNINIVKLPQADNGLTLMLITSLLEIEPALSDFIYVFDTPSADLAALKKNGGYGGRYRGLGRRRGGFCGQTVRSGGDQINRMGTSAGICLSIRLPK